jgi:uncharacterized membrane protein YgdD (TMEM256/DUF423 family)
MIFYFVCGFWCAAETGRPCGPKNLHRVPSAKIQDKKMKNLGLLSGILGLTGVALGAFGAHALKDFLLAHGTLDAWETGVRYHLFHSVALLALACSRQPPVAADLRAADSSSGRNLLAMAGCCFAGGVALFSGSLYAYALGGPHALVFITPLGGLVLLLGWASVIMHFAGMARVTP